MKLGRRDEAVERVGEIAQVGQFGGGEIVEGARTDVDVAILGGVAAFEELLPVAEGGFVGAGFGGGDRQVDGHADAFHRGGEQVGVGVGQDRQAPAVFSELRQRLRYFGEGGPVGQGVGKRILVL